MLKSIQIADFEMNVNAMKANPTTNCFRVKLRKPLPAMGTFFFEIGAQYPDEAAQQGKAREQEQAVGKRKSNHPSHLASIISPSQNKYFSKGGKKMLYFVNQDLVSEHSLM